MEYGLIGEKLGYSFSKEVHNKISDYGYELKEIPKDELIPFINSKNYKGLNVTIPYKSAVIPSLDVVSENARALNAVNTIINRDGVLYGENTDVYGAELLIRRSGIDMSGKKVLILGTGATSNTLSYVCRKLEAGEIIKASRSAKEGSVTYEEAVTDHNDTQIIINTTPVGTNPDIEKCPIDLKAFSSLSGVFDVIYNPLKSKLLRSAEKLGIPHSCGLYMLVGQAVCSSNFFLGKRTDCIDDLIQESDNIYIKVLKDKTNIVLIGMPSSGKSTLGKHLSKITGREFFDTDKMITGSTNMSIPDIFKNYGEAHFRELEKNAVHDVSLKSGAIIATGGGVILNPENIDNLKANGRIYFIDRPLDMLTATESRPLSRDIDALKARFKERYPIYRSVCDEVLNGKLTLKEEACNVIRLMNEYVTKQ